MNACAHSDLSVDRVEGHFLRVFEALVRYVLCWYDAVVRVDYDYDVTV